jgi:hypothetical protein
MFFAPYSFLATLFFLFRLSFSNAFSYNFGTPSQCDSFPITWTGGSPPFQLFLIPVFGTPRNISIPASAFNNGQGSYSFPLPLAQQSRMVLTMSDATGFNSGGTTNVLTVQPSKGGSCQTDAKVGFTFQLNSALQQCRPFVFSGYSSATQPVTIGAVIPGGEVLIFNPAPSLTSFTWNANVLHGTFMIFFMTDAQGRQGGSSDLITVGISDDSSCLDSTSPSSTSAAPSAPSSTKTPASSNSAAVPSSTSPSHHGTSMAAIAGTVIGALFFLAVIITLGLFFFRSKRDEMSSRQNFQSRRVGSEIDLNYNHSPPNYPNPSSYPYSTNTTSTVASNPFLDSNYPLPPSQNQLAEPYQPSTFNDTASQRSSTLLPYAIGTLGYNNQSIQQFYPPQQNYSPHSGPSPLEDPFNPRAGPPVLPGAEFDSFYVQGPSNQLTTQQPMGRQPSAAQRKAAMAGVTPYKPSRFIVHTDVEDDLPPPNEDGVVELPPQYSERRGPLTIANPTSPSHPDHPIEQNPS